MKWTQIRELGLAGRVLVSFLVGFSIAAVLVMGALLAATMDNRVGVAVALLLAPGFVTGGLLFNSEVGQLFGGWWINAGLYWILVFVIWQWQIRKRARRQR